MGEKITGYSLLFSGLGIMIFCVVSIIMVFTNKAKPFSYFNIASNNNSNNQGSSFDVNGSIPLPKFDLIPPEVLNQTLNLSTQFFLMTFILGFGYKIANLGIQLIRPINVKIKSPLLEVDDSNIPSVLSQNPQPQPQQQ